MSAYLITGTSGAGKTSVARELEHRGYTAYNTDDMPEVTSFYELASGLPIPQTPASPIDYDSYHWNWDITALQNLFDSKKPVFIAALTSNTVENLHLFDAVFALYPNAANLKHRLTTRTDHDFGKHPIEQAMILKNHRHSDEFWASHGAIIISGDQPLDSVTNDILDYLKLPREAAK